MGNKDVTQTHVLELNGKRYDALSGRPLENLRTLPHHEPAKSLDGVSRHVAHHETQTEHRAAPRPADTDRQAAHHARPHQQQHSKTLMRRSVQHPSTSLKRHLHSVGNTGSFMRATSFDILPKFSADEVDAARMRRAHSIARSRLISRFAITRPAPISTQHAQPLPAAPASIPLPAQVKPVSSAQTRQPSSDIFERALAQANSHKQPYAPVKKAKKHRLRSIASIAASALAVLLIAGFVAYQNEAAIQLRVASSRAGISATLPAWQPSGFKVGTFSYAPGTVTVKYQDEVAAKSFTIEQTASNLDSATLLSDYVYPNNETYNTLRSDGSTIYTYGNNDATWVSGGILYKLTSDGSLSNSQIVNIATSM